MFPKLVTAYSANIPTHVRKDPAGMREAGVNLNC